MLELKKIYHKEIIGKLMKDFNYKSIMQVPKIEKIVINAGIGDAVNDSKNIEFAINELHLITGQKPVATLSKKSIANYKVRKGQAIGVMVTLRNDIMWNFLEKLIYFALPRVRDFRGLSSKSFDGFGNYTLGIKEQIIFPEIHYDNIKRIRGFDVTIVTSSKTDKEALALLKYLGMPIINKENN